MLRETTFFAGGIAVIVVGVILGVALWWTGAGLEFWGAWLGAGMMVGLGAFFWSVGRDAQAYRRRWLKETEEGRPPPPGGPPG